MVHDYSFSMWFLKNDTKIFVFLKENLGHKYPKYEVFVKVFKCKLPFALFDFVLLLTKPIVIIEKERYMLSLR